MLELLVSFTALITACTFILMICTYKLLKEEFTDNNNKNQHPVISSKDFREHLHEKTNLRGKK